MPDPARWLATFEPKWVQPHVFTHPDDVSVALAKGPPTKVYLPVTWLSHLSGWQERFPHTRFIVWLPKEDGASVRAAFRAGADDVWFLPAGDDAGDSYIAGLNERAWQALQAFLAQLELVSPLAVFIFNRLEMRLEYLGQKIQQILGYSLADISQMGRMPDQVIAHVDSLGELMAMREETARMKPDELVSRTVRMKDQAGKWRWLEIQVKQIDRHPSGQTRRVLGTVQDVTSLREALERGNSAEALVTDVLKHVEEAVFKFVIPANSGLKQVRITYFSEASEKLWGLSREEIMKREHPETWEDFLPPASIKALLDLMNGDLRAGQPGEITYPYNHPGGEIRWIHNRTYPRPLPDGDIEVMGVARDVTDQKRAEEALRIRNRALAAVEDGVAVLKPQAEAYEIGFVNAGFTRITGYTGKELPTLAAFLDRCEASHGLDLARLREALAAQQPTQVVLRMQRKDDVPFWCEVNLVPVSAQQPAGNFVLAFKDVTSYIEAVQAQEAGKARQRLILDTLPAGVAVLDEDGYFTGVNHAWERLSVAMGETGAVVGGHYPTICAQATGPLAAYGACVAQALAQLQTGELQAFEGEVSVPGLHQLQWYLLRIVPLPGDKAGYVIARIDISAQKTAELALLASERRYRWLAESVEDVIILADMQGKVTFVNAAIQPMLGFAPTDLLGQQVDQIIHPDDLEAMHKAFHTGAKQGGPFHLVFRGRQATGEIIWLESLSRLIPAEGVENSLSILSVIRDVTLAKTAEARLHFQSTILDQVHNAVVGTDMEYRITYFNRAACELFGVAVEDTIGKSVLDIYEIQWDSDADRLASIETVQADGFWKGEVYLRRRSGTRFFADVTVSLLLDVDSRPVGYLGVIMDVSARKEAQDTLQRFNTELESRVKARTRELEEANRELEAFNFSISHDLRSPLRGISGFAQLLARRYRDLLDTDGQEYLDFITKDVRKMDLLIHDLLTFSRMGRYQYQPETLDMAWLVHDVWAEVTQNRPVAPAELIVGELPPLVSDRQLVRIILTNLLDNAVKYAGKESHPQVWVEGTREAGVVVYAVRDNGIGFDMTYHDRIFRVFQRLHTDQEYEGTGAGLSIVYRIVSRLEGKVWAESEPGAGATFYVQLPAISPAP